MMSGAQGTLDSLKGVATFVRAAEAKSFVAAGRQLGISASAVGKGVARLEARLGVQLFHRTTRSIALTGEGALLYERIAHILVDVAEAEAAVASTRSTPRGRLKVSAPHGLGQFVVAPILPEFCSRFSEIEVDLHLTDRVVNVVEECFDLVLRAAGAEHDSSLVAHRIAPHRFSVCAAPDYLTRAGIPRTPADLGTHEAVHFTFASTGRRQPWWFRDGAGWDAEAMPRGRLAFSSNAAILAAAVAGQGLAYLPCYVTAATVREGRLTTVLDGYVPARGTISALWPRTRRLAPKVRAFVSFVAPFVRDA